MVVTSDGAEQLIILGHGALRLPAASFRREVEEAEGRSPPSWPGTTGGALPAGEGERWSGPRRRSGAARERQEEVTAPPKQKAGPAGRPRSRGRHNRGWTGVYDI